MPKPKTQQRTPDAGLGTAGAHALGELSPALMFADLSEHQPQAGEDGLLWILGVPLAKYPEHPEYGDLDFSPARLKQYHDNISNRAYHIDPPIDYEHAPTTEGAAAWVKASELRDNGLWLGLEVSDTGRAAIEGKRFRYFSPTLYDSWRDPATGKQIANVLAGGALTINPYLKDAMGAHPIVFSDGVLIGLRGDGNGDGPNHEDRKEGTKTHEDDPAEGTTMSMSPEDINKLSDDNATLQAKVKALEGAGGGDEAAKKQLADNAKALADNAKALAATQKELAEERQLRVLRDIEERLAKVGVELAPGDRRALTPEGRKLLSALAVGLGEERPKVLNDKGESVDGIAPREALLAFAEALPKYLRPADQMGFTAQHADPANADPQQALDAAVEATIKAGGVKDDGAMKLSYEAALSLTMDEHPELVEAAEAQQKRLRGE